MKLSRSSRDLWATLLPALGALLALGIASRVATLGDLEALGGSYGQLGGAWSLAGLLAAGGGAALPPPVGGAPPWVGTAPRGPAAPPLGGGAAAGLGGARPPPRAVRPAAAGRRAGRPP